MEEEVANRKQRREKITRQGMKRFIFPFSCQLPMANKSCTQTNIDKHLFLFISNADWHYTGIK